MSIPRTTALRLKEAARIEEVVGDFVDLKKKGTRYLGLCPFHEDRNLGSFVVYPKENCYKCFACGAKGGSVDFLMRHEKLTYPDALRWLGKKYHIPTDMDDFKYTPPPPRPTPPPKAMLQLPPALVLSYQHNHLAADNLVRWMCRGIAWDFTQLSRIVGVLREYRVGRAANGMTLFWQIDEAGHVRTGKMMRYREDGHRDRESRYGFDWVHSALDRHHHPLFDSEKQEAVPTLFGMHLLNTYGRADVHIVESEKTALLMAIAYGNNDHHVWMACGGLEMLSRQRLAPIISQRRRIVLFPDRDGIDKWRAKAENLRYDLLTLNTDPVTRWWSEADGPKADIADVVVRMTNEHEAKPSDAAIQKLMEQLDLLPNI